MRYSPAHAAKSGSVPFMLRGPKPVRTAMSAAVAGIIGLVPTVMIASPAHAAFDELTITTTAATEGNAVRFAIKRDLAGGSPATRTLTYSTVDDATLYDGTTTGAAVAGKDYTATSGTLTFLSSAPGTEDIQYIDVPTLPDALDEFPEKFKIVVTESGNPATFASGSPANLIGTINDDANDTPPSYTLTATPATVTEPAAGSTTSTITAKLSGPSGKPIGVSVSTDNGTAKSGTDFNPLVAVPLTFAPGDEEKTTTVSILADTTKDTLDTESFSINGVGTNVSPTNRTVDVNITDRDTTPKITLTGGGAVAETSPVSNSTFTVHISPASEKDVTVHWDVVAADAVAGHGTATPSEDFTSYPDSASRTVTIPAGSTSKDIEIPIKNDGVDETSPEDFAVVLSAPVNAELGSPVKVAAQISDNAADLPPTVTITPIAVDEGDSGYNSRTFTATLAAKSGRPVKVDYATYVDGSVGVGKALPGRDFVYKEGTLTFPVGTTTQNFTVDVIGDKVDEGAGETFDISLTDVDGTATLVSGFYQDNVVTITDDDAAPTFTVDDVVVKEGDEPGVALMPIKLSGASESNLLFDVTAAATQSDTATESVEEWWGSNDFDNPVTPVTVPAGQTTGYALVYINGDQVYETDETTHFSVAVNVGSTGLVTGSAKTPMVTLTNDDVAPELEINNVTGNEGDTVKVTGIVSGMAQAHVPTNITFAGAAADGKAAASANDFTNPGAKAVTILGGTMPGTVLDVADVMLTEDAAKEPAETIVVSGIGLGNVGTVTAGVITIAASDGGTDPTDPGTDSPTLKASGSFRLGAGTVTLTGKAAAGTTVDLWGRTVNASDEDYAKISSTTANSSGTFVFTPGLSTDGMYFKAAASGEESDPVRVYVKEDPDLSATSTSRGVVRLVVTGDPKVRGLGARVFRANANGTWTMVGSGILNANGTFSKTLLRQKSGKMYTFKAYVVGDGPRGVLTNWSSYSKTVRVK